MTLRPKGVMGCKQETEQNHGYPRRRLWPTPPAPVSFTGFSAPAEPGDVLFSADRTGAPDLGLTA